MFNIGYDLYHIEKYLIFIFLRYAKINKIKILHLRYHDDMYSFYIPTYQRYKLKNFKEPLYYEATIGLTKYFFFLTRQYLNIIGVICFLGSIVACSYFIFDIQIIGTMPKVNQQILQELNDEHVSVFSSLKKYERLNDLLAILKTNHKKDVEYMNIYQKGSVFYVEYTKRKQDEIVKDDYGNLYAKKDGLISSLDVESGLIKVKKNDYVKKGDLLVENTIISTQNEIKIIPVKGHVYAYVFEQYEASVKNVDQDDGEVFYQLLLKIRSQLPSDVVIDKENVLQIDKNSSTITLKMHYTLIEDIAIKGETNEESH